MNSDIRVSIPILDTQITLNPFFKPTSEEMLFQSSDALVDFQTTAEDEELFTSYKDVLVLCNEISKTGNIHKKTFLKFLNSKDSDIFIRELTHSCNCKGKNVFSIIGKNFSKEEATDVSKKLATTFVENEKNIPNEYLSEKNEFLLAVKDSILSNDDNSTDFLNEVINQADEEIVAKLQYLEKYYGNDKKFQEELSKLDIKFQKFFSNELNRFESMNSTNLQQV